MADRQIGAEAGFSQALKLLRKALETEDRARVEPGCARGLLKGAAKHRADAEALLWDGLIETQP